jgi:hypothetical protein
LTTTTKQKSGTLQKELVLNFLQRQASAVLKSLKGIFPFELTEWQNPSQSPFKKGEVTLLLDNSDTQLSTTLINHKQDSYQADISFFRMDFLYTVYVTLLNEHSRPM